MKCVRLYTDNDGRSRFEDLVFTFAAQDFAPPAPPLEVSDPIPASAFMLLRGPGGWEDPMHPAPARQLVITLKGVWEVIAGGETRSFGPGDMILTEDTRGAGHGARAVEDAVLAVVRL